MPLTIYEQATLSYIECAARNTDVRFRFFSSIRRQFKTAANGSPVGSNNTKRLVTLAQVMNKIKSLPQFLTDGILC